MFSIMHKRYIFQVNKTEINRKRYIIHKKYSSILKCNKSEIFHEFFNIKNSDILNNAKMLTLALESNDFYPVILQRRDQFLYYYIYIINDYMEASEPK